MDYVKYHTKRMIGSTTPLDTSFVESALMQNIISMFMGTMAGGGTPPMDAAEALAKLDGRPVLFIQGKADPMLYELSERTAALAPTMQQSSGAVALGHEPLREGGRRVRQGAGRILHAGARLEPPPSSDSRRAPPAPGAEPEFLAAACSSSPRPTPERPRPDARSMTTRGRDPVERFGHEARVGGEACCPVVARDAEDASPARGRHDLGNLIGGFGDENLPCSSTTTRRSCRTPALLDHAEQQDLSPGRSASSAARESAPGLARGQLAEEQRRDEARGERRAAASPHAPQTRR